MVRHLTIGSRRLGGALALTLAFVSSATCLASVAGAPAPDSHACCASMAGGCGSEATVDQSCCAAQQPGLTGLAPVASFTLAAPASTETVLLLSLVVPPLASAAFDADTSNPISPPPYLLDSVFRI